MPNPIEGALQKPKISNLGLFKFRGLALELRILELRIRKLAFQNLPRSIDTDYSQLPARLISYLNFRCPPRNFDLALSIALGLVLVRCLSMHGLTMKFEMINS